MLLDNIQTIIRRTPVTCSAPPSRGIEKSPSAGWGAWAGASMFGTERNVTLTQHAIPLQRLLTTT